MASAHIHTASKKLPVASITMLVIHTYYSG
jgi:hypothetical protein